MNLKLPNGNPITKRTVLLAVGLLVLLIAIVLAVCLYSTVITKQKIAAGSDVSSGSTAQSESTSQSEEEKIQSSVSAPQNDQASSHTGFVWQEAPYVEPNTGEANQPEQGNTFVLPYTMADQGLVIHQMESYSGIYFEDGSDTEVSDVAVIMLENTQDTVVEFARITFKVNDTTMVFEASAVPPKSTVVVQESEKKAYQTGTFSECTAEVARLDAFELSEDKVKVEDNGDGSLTVTNLTPEKIPVVRVFYKYYMAENNIYVGGIAYNAKITELEGESSVKVTPAHYVSGSAKVLMVRTYDSE